MQDNELVSPEEDGEQQKEGRCKKTSNEEKTTVFDKAKGVLAVIKDGAIELWNGNKHWIVPAAGALLIGEIVKQVKDNDELRQENERLNGEVDTLRQEN